MRGKLTVLCAAITAAIMFGFVSPVFILVLYRYALPTNDVSILKFLFLVVVAAYGLYGILEYVCTKMTRELEVEFGEIYIEAASDGVSVSHDGGKNPAASAGDLGRVQSFIASDSLVTLLEVPWSLVFLTLMLILHWSLALLSLCFTVLLAAVEIAIQNSSRAASNDGQQIRSAGSYKAGDRGSGSVASRLRASALSRKVSQKRRHYTAQRKTDLLTAFCSAVRNLHVVSILALAAYLTLDHLVVAGTMLASALLARRISDPIDNLVRSRERIVGTWNSLERLRNARVAHVQSRPPAGIRLTSGDVVLEKLKVGVPGTETPVLGPLSVRLRPGETLLVLGGNGTGKTALANTLWGVWRPISGKIWIGGLDWFSLSDAEAEGIIGYLPERPHFHPGSIADNISRFSPSPNDRMLMSALDASGVREFVFNLPEGLDTEIEDVLPRVSESTRKKIALARAIYGNPLVLVLDDPMAHLDDESRLRILDILAKHRETGGIAVICTNEELPRVTATTLALDSFRIGSEAEQHFQMSTAI